MVSIESPPTVDLFLVIPTPLASGWAWSEHPRFAGVLASEYVYSAHEATSTVRAYGRVMSWHVRPQEAERFAVLGRGRVSRMILARDEWYWDAMTHEFQPVGEPWCTWREAARAYFEITGCLIERQRFRARIDPC